MTSRNCYQSISGVWKEVNRFCRTLFQTGKIADLILQVVIHYIKYIILNCIKSRCGTNIISCVTSVGDENNSYPSEGIDICITHKPVGLTRATPHCGRRRQYNILSRNLKGNMCAQPPAIEEVVIILTFGLQCCNSDGFSTFAPFK